MLTQRSRHALVPACAGTLTALVAIGWLNTVDDERGPHAVAGGSTTIASTPQDGGPSETGIGATPIFSQQGNGTNLLPAGVSTRRTLKPAAAIAQTEPFNLVAPALPAGAQVVRVFIGWSWLINGTPPAGDQIQVNGVSVFGVLRGTGTPDLCWGKTIAASYLAEILPAGNPVTFNGVSDNAIANATDKALGTDPLALGDGLTILCVYDYPPSVPTCPRSVSVYTGYTSTESDPSVSLQAVVPMDFGTSWPGGELRLFLNCLDGQSGFGDDLFVNSTLVSGVLAGTGVAGDAWTGKLGPGTTSGVSNLYDHTLADVSGLLSAPTSGLTVRSVSVPAPGTGTRDCVAHTLAAISFITEVPWAEWSPGKAGTGGLVPLLQGFGDVVSGSPNFSTISLTQAKPLSVARLVYGAFSLRLPFKGGILGPDPTPPFGDIIPLATNSSGALILPFTVPAGIFPCALPIWIQYVITDSAATQGLALSNTIKMTIH